MRGFWLVLRFAFIAGCVWYGGAVAPLPVSGQEMMRVPLDFLPQGGSAYLSPDGERIAHLSGTTLCIYDIAGGTPTCADLPGGFDRSSVRWSPDSTRLAFTEDFPIRLIDADIWTMDATTGAMTNLTDDGVQGRISISEPTLAGPLDAAPQWSADSTQLTFVRYTRPDPQFVATLCVVSAIGSPVAELRRLPNTALDVFVADLAADGTHVAFGTGTGPGDPMAGAWVANADGTDARRITGGFVPAQVAFSPDTRALLTFDHILLGQYATQWEMSTNRVYPTDGTGDAPVDRDHAAHWAGWSPRSDALVYLVRDGVPQLRVGASIAGVYVVARPGASGQQVLAGTFAGPMPGTYGERGLTWAANDTTLVRDTTTNTFALVRLPPSP